MHSDDDQDITKLSLQHSAILSQAIGTARIPVPALTILYHPDLRRIGDRLLLKSLPAGHEEPISRKQPPFTSPQWSEGMPLAERHLSRKPLYLRPASGGDIELDIGESRTKVVIDGHRVRDRWRFTPGDVEQGVILELADNVALLLHYHVSAANPDAEDDLGLVGVSAAIARVREEVRRVADTEVTVLVRGETGTGKELVANAIHRSSQRSERPLVSVNLGAIPSSLAAAELFGAARGAFTNAIQAQEGYFRRADKGTLFLDEIGEVPTDVQVMLLRVLENGEVHMLGAQRPDRVDTRVITATDANLEALVADGSFRAPLLHRLSEYEILVPPLRERKEDISRLLVHFLRIDLAELDESKRLEQIEPKPWLPMSIVIRLLRYDWPGNVRQLRNVAKQLAIRNRGRAVAELPEQLDRLLGSSESSERTFHSESDLDIEAERKSKSNGLDSTIRRRPGEISEVELIEALRSKRWDLKATAAALGISRTSLYSLISDSNQIRTAGDLAAGEIEDCYRECQGDLEAMVDRLQVSKRALRRRVRELGLA